MSDGHGNTPAAWTAVVVMLLGFVVGAVGLMIEPISQPVFFVGVGITVLGGLLFFVLAKAGFHETSH